MADSIIIKVPPLTEERRLEVAKIVKRLSEEAKVSVRNARADSHKDINKAKEDKEISEDEAKDLNTNLKKLVDE
jgi:ribosome recycling factor